MTLYQIFDLCNFIAGKFPSGGSILPSRFNLLLSQVNNEYFQSCLKIDSASPALLPFKKTDTITANEVGVATLPSDYKQFIEASSEVLYDENAGLSIPNFRPITLVDDKEFNIRRQNVFTRADIFPFAKCSNGNLYVIPYNIGSFTLGYFRLPLDPVSDWCQDALNPTKTIYMPTGSVILGNDVTENTFDLYDKPGTGRVLLYSNVTRTGLSPWTEFGIAYTSTTIEFEWDVQYHYHLVYLLLSKIGIPLSEDKVVQYAVAMSQQ